ncbi:MAG: hypothetical protein ACK4N1_16580 [Pseudorhizobium sp.]
MRIVILAAALSLVSSLASAAEPVDPVREVMEVTAGNWSSSESEWRYIFDEEPLQRLYSQRFRAAYVEASKKPAYETDDGGPGDPFGYDVVTASQDGCPLEDVGIEADGEENDVTTVKVRFKLWRCIDQAELKDTTEEVHFDVVAENGSYVIDDIHRVSSGERDSVLEEMKQLAVGSD